MTENHQTENHQTENHQTFMARFANQKRGFRYTVEEAYMLAKYAHRAQKRWGGERYFDHPRAVAIILYEELNVEEADVLAAGLLHDTVEDTPYLTVDFIEYIFGVGVSDLVDLVTKRKDRGDDWYWQRLASTWMADAVVLKVADRVHNLRCTATKNKLRETRERLVPIVDAACARYPTNESLKKAQALLAAELAKHPGGTP